MIRLPRIGILRIAELDSPVPADARRVRPAMQKDNGGPARLDDEPDGGGRLLRKSSSLAGKRPMAEVLDGTAPGSASLPGSVQRGHDLPHAGGLCYVLRASSGRG